MTVRRAVPAEVRAYGSKVAANLHAVLGDALHGVYFVGSIALGGYVAGESDIDMVAVSEHAIVDQMKPQLAAAVYDTTKSCPTRGLEFTLYRRAVARSTPVAADFEINVNGGPRMARDIHLDPRSEPPFWYVLDRAIAHRCGVEIAGPPPADVFADVSREALLDAMIQSMRWHREHEKTALYSVLNACRAWRFAAEDVMGSKLEGAAWARERWPSTWVIDAAVDLRHGRQATLDPAEVNALLDHVESTLVANSADRYRPSDQPPST
ncbi:MAG TPA: aminoglycoside adenylyltransferase domain-containing protein, partial [Actinomycetes bacterium]|nr:aminoglycoside adenylyltransferase domain-containing protein [Actinomycetes bacterium]